MENGEGWSIGTPSGKLNAYAEHELQKRAAVRSVHQAQKCRNGCQYPMWKVRMLSWDSESYEISWQETSTLFNSYDTC